MPRFLSLLVLVACSAKPEVQDDTADTSTDTSTSPVVEVNPFVAVVDRVECTTQQSAGDTWDIGLTVDDPQGSDTVSDGEYAVLSEKGGELTRQTLACGNGGCFGSFRADLTGIGCDMQGDVSLSFVVEDEDGNLSEAFVYQTK